MRSKGERGPSLCHVCREEIDKTYRIPLLTDEGEWVVGATWKVCYNCARKEQDVINRESS